MIDSPIPNVSKTTRLIPRDQIEYRSTRSGGILVDVKTGACFELNGVGAEVWARLAAGGTVGDAMDAVRSRYDVVAGVVESDVSRICGEIVAAGLVVRADEGTS